MARRKISAEQAKDEGAKLLQFFVEAQKEDPSFTQEVFAGELGVTQGLISQWFKGKTPIPDKTLIKLGQRFGFNPAEFRPSILELSVHPSGASKSKLNRVIDQIPPGEEDRVADILAPIVEALKDRQ